MDLSAYSVRPFVDADYEVDAFLERELDPGSAHSAEEIRHWDETSAAVPGRLLYRLAVDHRGSGTTVALGSLHNLGSSHHPRKFWVRVVVAKAHRGRGVGRELYRLVEQEAVSRHVLCLWSAAREDDAAALGFLERRGFVPVRTQWSSRLDFATTKPSPLPDRSGKLLEAGIRITTVAAEGYSRPEVRQRLYELEVLTGADVPRVGEYTPYTFEEFLAFDYQGPGAIPDGIFLACRGDEYVGVSSLERQQAQPDTLLVGYTGVHPDWRGRGVASELKRRAVEYARTLGYRFLLTYNDSLNPAILAINTRLGFRRDDGWITKEKTFTLLAPPRRTPE